MLSSWHESSFYRNRIFPIYSCVDKNAILPSKHYDTFTEYADTFQAIFMNNSSLDSCRVYFRSKNDRVFRTFIIFLRFWNTNVLDVSRYSNIHEIKFTGEKPLLQIQYQTHIPPTLIKSIN